MRLPAGLSAWSRTASKFAGRRRSHAHWMRCAPRRACEGGKRLAALARAFAASTSRSRGGASVTKRIDELARRLGDLLNRAGERLLVCFGGAREAAQLSDELQS